jgi:exonuclease SbcD
MLRILHTSDWHLGHTLRDLSRAREHRLFFEFLYEVIREHAVDVLLVSGDVF